MTKMGHKKKKQQRCKYCKHELNDIKDQNKQPMAGNAQPESSEILLHINLSFYEETSTYKQNHDHSIVYF